MSRAPRERTLDVRGGALTARVREAGSGPAAVYLHGAEGPDEAWPTFLAGLSETFRVIAPDLPGFGQSTGGDQMRDVLDLSIYLQDLLDALGLARAHLIGHDFGGMAAAELAAVADRRVGMLVLLAPLGLWDDADPILDFFATPREELLSLAWHDPSSAAAVSAHTGGGTEDELHERGLERTRNLATATRLLWPIPDRGLRRRIHRLTAPTLLVWGVSDRVVPPSYGERWQRAIPGSRIAVIEGAGHYPAHEQPEATLDVVRTFLAG